MRIQRSRLFLLLVMLSLQCPSLFGETPRAAIRQIGHDTWTFKEGAPANVGTLAQTADGFLWIGTPSGLFRFDGSRFERFDSPFGDRLLSTDVTALFAPASGGLWIGFRFGGFSFLDHGRVKNYAGETASSGTVWALTQARDGVVWAATTSGLWRFERSSWQRLGVEWNAQIEIADHAAFDRDGILWVIGEGKLLCLPPGRRRFQVVEKNLSVAGFTLDADGAVVTSPAPDRRTSNHGGNPEDPPPTYPVLRKESAQIVDRANGVWIVPKDCRFVSRLSSFEQFHHASNGAVAASSETYRITPDSRTRLVDREGNIWFGDHTGIHRFFYSPLIKQQLPKSVEGFALAADDQGGVWIYSERSYLQYISNGGVKTLQKLHGELTSFAYRAPDKTFWFGGSSGLWHLVGRRLIRTDLPRAVADQASFMQAVTMDPRGGLWVSFGRRGLYRLADGVWTPYGGREDLPRTGVVSEFTDSLGRVWFGYTKSQLALLDGDRVQVFGPGDGLQVGNITAIYGRGSEVWIGGEFGLQQFDHGRFHNITPLNQQLLQGISGIVETDGGDLWINGLSGIFHLGRAEISKALKNHAAQVKGNHFGRRDGLPGLAGWIRPLQTVIESSDRRLWFVTTNGVVWLDPAQAQKKVLPPPVTIQSISADDQNYEFASPPTLPPGTASVRINYAAVSLSNPEAIRFRYRLQEVDRDWHEVPSIGAVTYRNLSPGSYHFSVAATDTGGSWSDQVASVEFAILPAYYQTAWFLALGITCAVAALYLLYLLRLRQVTRQVRGRLEARLNERERIARELHDTLLQSVVGLILKFQTIAQRMPGEESARQTMNQALDYADRVLREGRDRVRNLRDNAAALRDLPRAFQKVVEELSLDRATSFKTTVTGAVQELHPMVLEEGYSIGREALINALIHSECLTLNAEIVYDSRQFRLLVRDDGRGIDSRILEDGGRPGHWGMQGMRERARRIGAQLEFRSGPETGTEVELMVPGATAYRTVRAKSQRFRFRRSCDVD
ncbi:MAG TPA: triple tyrosine motif-containing protein [Blastocatellia bacterium]|nr:triple tyrosine motif-containing protein [Blastocatellia bacterium]